MQDIEIVKGRKGAIVRIGGVEVPVVGMTDVSCSVRGDAMTEVTITYLTSRLNIVDETYVLPE